MDMSEEKKIHIPEEHVDLEEKIFLKGLVEFSSVIEEGMTAGEILLSEPKKAKPVEENTAKHEYYERKRNKSNLF